MPKATGNNSTRAPSRPDHPDCDIPALDTAAVLARAKSAVLDEVAERAEAAARDLLALAPTPQQRGTVALVALHAIEREFAKAVRS